MVLFLSEARIYLLNCSSCRNRNVLGADRHREVRGSPGWSPWHPIPLAVSFQSLLVSSSGQQALTPRHCTDGKVPHSSHSWWKSASLGAKAKCQPSWNNDFQADVLGMGREKQSHHLALKGKGLSLPGWILGRLR